MAPWARWAIPLCCVAGCHGAVLAAQHEPPAVAADRCPVRAISLEVGVSWQPKVRAAPAGAVFCVRSGTHRAQTVFPKDNQQFLGEPGAIMSGATLIAGATRLGRYWVAAGPMQHSEIRGVCVHDRPACSDPTTVFIDGRPLDPVPRLDHVHSGTFFRDKATGSFYFVDDPTGKTIEATAAAFAFMPNHARNVVIKGLTVEKYGNPAQLGAIYADADETASGWLIENNDVRLNSGAGIVAGRGAVVRGNKVHDNGQLGIHPHGDSVLIDHNEIAFNNARGFDPGWDAGGLKAAAVKDLVVRDNWVHHNHGPGLWCDIVCRLVMDKNNKVEYNADSGILYEISYDAVIRNNLVRWNGQGGDGSNGHAWFWGAEIQIAASEHVEVDHNTVFVGPGGGGIVLVDQGRRKDDKKTYYKTAQNAVNDNEIWFDGPGVKDGGVSDVANTDPNYAVIETGGNRFDGNHYHVSGPACACVFAWGHATYDFATFQGLGQEKNGRLLAASALP